MIRCGREGYWHYDVVHVGVGDEEEVLGDGALGASTDVESEVERGEDYTGLLPTD